MASKKYFLLTPSEMEELKTVMMSVHSSPGYIELNNLFRLYLMLSYKKTIKLNK